MGAGFNALAQAGVQNAEQQKQIDDEQRKVTLKTLQDDAETPADKLAAIQAVYHKDPGVLKQHVENMTRKLAGKPTQPVVTPQQAQQARIAPIAARGKTPDQQDLELKQQTGAMQNKQTLDFDQQQAQQKQQQITDLITKYVPKEQQAQALEDFTRKQAGIVESLKNIPGAAGQPYQSPNGQWVRPVQQTDGTIAEQPMPGGWKPPAPKQSITPKVGTSGGKNVYAMLTPEGWVDAGTKQPLKDFRPLPTYAQTGTYRVEPMQMPDGTITSALLNGKTGQFKPVTSKDGQPIAPSLMAQVNKSVEPALEANTRYDVMKENEQDALSGNQQAMLSLVANHIGMTLGAQKGARINQAVWNEAVQSAPWLQRAEAKWGPDGVLSGVTLSPEQIRQMVGLAGQRRAAQWKQVQDAAATYGVNVPVPDDIPASGKGPAPKKGQQKAIVQHSASTGQYRYSLDGGKTWQPGQPPK